MCNSSQPLGPIFLVAIITAFFPIETSVLSAQQPQDQPQDQPQQPLTSVDRNKKGVEVVLSDRADSGWAALPVVMASPETGLGLGGFGVHFFRLGNASLASRTSSLALVLLYTTRQQFIGELIPEFYWDDERWHIWSELDFRHYSNYFWGIGNDMPESQKEEYNETSPRGQIWIRRLIYLSFYLEARIDVQYMSISRVKRGGLLDKRAVPGAVAGRTVGTGMTVGWDTRDHAFAPHQGSFHEFSLMTWQRYLGSQYSYNGLSLNLRQFIPVNRIHTLALQVYSIFLIGEVPFYQMAMIGGQRLLRGYYEGRYRDYDLIAFQAEYRLPIWWRFTGVIFSGIGDVADRLEKFKFSRPKWTIGGGLRVILNQDEQLRLRFDCGFGDETMGIYLGVNEAF